MSNTNTAYRCTLSWGRHGVLQAAQRGDVVVIVDVLSFSTATAIAIQQGAFIYPCAYNEDPTILATRIGAEVAVMRNEVPHKGRFSLSPPTFLQIEPGTRVVVASPNGATCSRYAQQIDFLFAGSLLNAQAVASAVAEIMERHKLNVTVVACGERWRPATEDGELRVALEDFLGAGAILSALPYRQSPDAQVCTNAFIHSQDRLAELLWDCDSGQELYEKGFAEDVRLAARLNQYHTAPIMNGDHFELFDTTRRSRHAGPDQRPCS
ncbi:hypothetical protein KDA_29360 [Dictyobacter alpinus]|uniref:Probable 2-phosphosulfolactate phosphatase n=1 Tax=Dictyobacter alpinus TaxID=2014873 RepID=A0A402B811_9CHLR|nr:2-phosphosulfolactate phosphatase [Dictyobacter alpinus]GCE27452.1 hypothetical protein KDA_29360 [Dictyobacter alpinus]